MAPEVALLDAVLKKLKADSVLSAMLGARIFDEVPTDDRGVSTARPPYVYIGPIATVDDNAICSDHYNLRMRVMVVSDRFARREAWNILHEVRRVLRRAIGDGRPALTLAAPHDLADASFAASGDITEPNGLKTAFIDLAATITSDCTSD